MGTQHIPFSLYSKKFIFVDFFDLRKKTRHTCAVVCVFKNVKLANLGYFKSGIFDAKQRAH